MIDDPLSLKQHISFVCSRISRNTGIFLELRHFLPLQQLKQLYYCLIYPYISYAIVARGSSCKSHLQKLQTKQNHLFRAIFFATLYGKYTESALPFLNLLDILTVDNVYKLQTLKFVHQWNKKQLPVIFNLYFQYAKDIHSYNTRFASKNNLYEPRCRTNAGRRTVSSMATDIWLDLPLDIKQIQNTKNFQLESEKSIAI